MCLRQTFVRLSHFTVGRKPKRRGLDFMGVSERKRQTLAGASKEMAAKNKTPPGPTP